MEGAEGKGQPPPHRGGKYLKYLYSLHEKRGTLDVANVRELCPHCNMRSCCERDGTVEKLSVYCMEGCFHK